MMTMPQISTLLAESAVLPLNKTLEIDLSAVTAVDTASISLLFEWLRLAHTHKCKLAFSNLPQTLLSLAALYGVLELIPQTSH